MIGAAFFIVFLLSAFFIYAFNMIMDRAGSGGIPLDSVTAVLLLLSGLVVLGMYYAERGVV